MFNIYSEDPIASSDTVKSTPTEIPAMEESVPVCLCQNCPDLEKEQFSRCCHSNVKAKGICTKLAIQCICLSPKLEKFFDKVIYDFYILLKTKITMQDVLELLLFSYFDTWRIDYSDPPENRYDKYV